VVIGSLAVLVLLAAAPATGALPLGSLTPVTVAPRSGGRHTRFRVSFRNPVPTGETGMIYRSDTLSVRGPGGRGCRSNESMTLPPGGLHSEVRVTLAPGVRGWCAGRFAGEIIEFARVICGGQPLVACPQFVIAPETVARLRFTVTRASHRRV
jgi:hypothetical protein